MISTSNILWKIAYFCIFCHVSKAHREHKVHNIVLYPDKHSWCNTTPIKQVVTYPGCDSVEIDNNVCVGACFSYSIPHIDPSDPGEIIKPYCDSCQPLDVTWKHVTLECNGDEAEALEMVKHVQIIKNCSCNSCESRDDLTNPTVYSSGDGEIDHGTSQMELQGLINLMADRERETKNEISNNTEMKSLATRKKLLKLLARFGNEDDDFENTGSGSTGEGYNIEDNESHTELLKELLKQAMGSEHKFKEENLGQIVKDIENQEHIKLSLNKLRYVLRQLEKNVTEERETPRNHSLPEHKHHKQSHHHHYHHNHHHPAEKNHLHFVKSEIANENANINIMNKGVDSSHSLGLNTQSKNSENNNGSEMGEKPERYEHNDENILFNNESLNATVDALEHDFKPAVEGQEISYHGNIPPLTHIDSEK